MSRIASPGGSFLKTGNYRNPELLRLARLAPRCMGCGSPNQGDVVAAHSNQYRDGHGRSIKASDHRIAFLCTHPCHHELDQGSRWSKAERVQFFEDAHRETLGWLFESGHLVVR